MSFKFVKFPLRRLIVPITFTVSPGAAQAHVKWFCAFDVAGSPAGMLTLLCQDFEQLVALSIGLLVLGGLVETLPLGQAILRALDRTTSLLRPHAALLVRLVAGGFFVSLWATQNVLLTPELKTELSFVPWLQLAIAAAMLSRRTLPLAGLGIFALFCLAVGQYGVFHLMDYPVFIGLAIYLACIGLERSPFGWRPLDILRWSAAITLMWASVEKWAYPQWTFPIFVEHPALSLGMDVAYYMQAAGAVEFTLAFALLGTPLVRRSSAIILAAMFIGAIGEFGMIDAIGHSCIIVVLLVVLADDARVQVRRRAVFVTPLSYSATLAAFLLAYYGLHTALYGTASV